MKIRLSLAALAAAAAALSAAPAFGTVTTATRSVSCIGTGGAMTCALPFTFQKTTDLVVTVNGALKTIGTDYTVSCAGCSSGGSVTMVSNPSVGATVLITRTVPYTQLFDPRTEGVYQAKSHGAAFDTLEMQIQQLQQQPVGGDLAGFLPNPSLAPSGVIAGTYGNTTNIPVLTLDTKGRVTAASLTPVTATGTTTNYTAPFVDAVTRASASKMGDFVSFTDFGAVGDDSHDDTANIQKAITDANGRSVYCPDGTYKVTGTISVAIANTRIWGSGGCKIHMAFTASLPAGGVLFDVTTSGIQFERVRVVSTGTLNSPIATINHYAIKFHGTSGAHLTHLKVINCDFIDLPWNDTLGAVVATHAIYFQWADDVAVEDSRIDNVAGAGVFLSGVNIANILHNEINDTAWYSIQANDVVSNLRISRNDITGNRPGDRVWGGSINLMSNDSTGTACGAGTGCARITHVEIDHNYIAGVHSYTAAVHIESCSYVKFHDNRMEKVTLTLVADMVARYGPFPGGIPFYPDGSPAVYVRPYVRPTNNPPTGNEGPNDHIEATNNLLIAGSPGAIAFYADAQDNGSAGSPLFAPLPYSDTLTFIGNQIKSLDTTHYFSNAITVHGQQGGWKNVIVSTNEVSGFPDGTSPNGGLIGLQANSGIPLLDATVTGNQVKVIGGTPTTTTQLGIGVGSSVQRTIVGSNNVQGFWTGIRLFTGSSGTVLSGANLFSGSLNTDYLLSVPFANKGSLTLAAGTGSIVVQNGAVQCQCTDTTAAAAVKCAVTTSGTPPSITTTLTATGTSTDVIAFSCN